MVGREEKRREEKRREEKRREEKWEEGKERRGKGLKCCCKDIDFVIYLKNRQTVFLYGDLPKIILKSYFIA